MRLTFRDPVQTNFGGRIVFFKLSGRGIVFIVLVQRICVCPSPNIPEVVCCKNQSNDPIYLNAKQFRYDKLYNKMVE